MKHAGVWSAAQYRSRSKRGHAGVVRFLLGVSVALAVCAGCGPRQTGKTAPGQANTGTRPEPKRLVVLHAASLALPFAEIERLMEERHPGLDVIRESSSSRFAIRKITELHRTADILATADDFLLRDLMFPDAADWCAVFARNRIVIGFTDRSRYNDKIDADNWYEILLRKDVRFGYANPNMAPVGYRTWLCWKLADIYYKDRLNGRSLFEELKKACPPQNIRPHVNELLPPLESLRLDYVFLYRSVALQHHLKWIKLPDEIDLGNVHMADWYGQVAVEIAGKRPGEKIVRKGRPISYGITIPKVARARKSAEEFLAILLGPQGKKIMEANFQEPIQPAYCYGLDHAPAALRDYLQPAPSSDSKASARTSAQ